MRKFAHILVILGAVLLIIAIAVGIVAGKLYEPYANWILVSSCVCVWLGIPLSVLCEHAKT